MKSLASLSVLIAASLAAACAAGPATKQNANPNIDYPGFAALVGDVETYRAKRLIDLDTFLRYAADEDTIILDSRSAEAFARGHINGAVNLPFSDFTQEKLDTLIGDKSRRILIYCNNNFADNAEPVPLKRVELALNIPTFINLYGYGYENIYELEEVISLNDQRLAFVRRS
ncbi:rhodanese-like domain-containing protein [Hyphococcus sp.]|uniref:rhodanese-like domain-containing protein n=1 Tax=Hyphococcus sp. TaxID=2038636 RepID=UPI003D13A434